MSFFPDRDQKWHRFGPVIVPFEVEDKRSARFINGVIALIVILGLLTVGLVVLALTGVRIPLDVVFYPNG
jgi:hypothetical protein